MKKARGTCRASGRECKRRDPGGGEAQEKKSRVEEESGKRNGRVLLVRRSRAEKDVRGVEACGQARAGRGTALTAGGGGGVLKRQCEVWSTRGAQWQARGRRCAGGRGQCRKRKKTKNERERQEGRPGTE